MADLFLAFCTGLGPRLEDYTDGPLVKMRNFLDEFRKNSGVTFLSAAWDDPASLRAVAAEIDRHEHAELVGLSHGAWRMTEIAAGKYGPVKNVDWLIALDQIPPEDEGWEFADDPAVPAAAKNAISIYGLWDPLPGGKKFLPPGTNIYLPDGHAGFAGDDDVIEFIGARGMELLTA